MKATKILERQAVIQFFGLALILAPFINIILMLFMIKNQMHLSWEALPLFRIFASGKITNYLLIIASLAIGAIMLTGSRKAWKYTLILIGSHVLMQIPTIGQDIRQNWLWGPLFLINIGLLIFIADQLVFRQGQDTAPEPTRPTATAPQIKKQMKPVASAENLRTLKRQNLVVLKNFGAWAEIKSLSKNGFCLRSLSEKVPTEIESREIEMSFTKNIFIKARFQSRQKQDFYFNFDSLNSSQSQSIEHWLNKHAG